MNNLYGNIVGWGKYVPENILSNYFSEKFPGHAWSELSMGMSGDYEVAIQEGATMVRIGTAILGERQIREG